MWECETWRGAVLAACCWVATAMREWGPSWGRALEGGYGGGGGERGGETEEMALEAY